MIMYTVNVDTTDEAVLIFEALAVRGTPATHLDGISVAFDEDGYDALADDAEATITVAEAFGVRHLYVGEIEYTLHTV